MAIKLEVLDYSEEYDEEYLDPLLNESVLSTDIKIEKIKVEEPSKYYSSILNDVKFEKEEIVIEKNDDDNIMPGDRMQKRNMENFVQCALCFKRFSQKPKLEVHMRYHKGIKPFQCNICEKRFAEKSNLVRHLRIHTGERPYSCKLCRKTFSQNSHLKDHMKTHLRNPENKCNFCESVFKTAFELQTHMFVHTPEKPFKCKRCGNSYSQKQHLNRHIKNTCQNK